MIPKVGGQYENEIDYEAVGRDMAKFKRIVVDANSRTRSLSLLRFNMESKDKTCDDYWTNPLASKGAETAGSRLESNNSFSTYYQKNGTMPHLVNSKSMVHSTKGPLMGSKGFG